jgi:hypothetical protein
MVNQLFYVLKSIHLYDLLLEQTLIFLLTLYFQLQLSQFVISLYIRILAGWTYSSVECLDDFHLWALLPSRAKPLFNQQLVAKI